MSEYIEFQEGKKYPSKNADRAANPDLFKDAGYIIKENELVVDVDNMPKETIKKMIDYFKIDTHTVWTDSGAHFYYKKPEGWKGNKAVCALGFEIEYKHSKNTPNGVTIKRNGKMRKVDNEGRRGDLPDFFKYKRNLKSMVGLEENDGRNNYLFAHRMRIFEMPQWKSVLRFINNYIFAAPLGEKEFQEITRDGVKPQAEKDNQPEMARYLIDKYKIVSYLGRLYWFINGEYIDDTEITNRLIAEEIPEKKTNYYKEIISQMDFKAPLIDSEKTFEIKLQNGFLKDGKFFEIDFEEFTPYSIAIPYKMDAAAVPVIDEYLEHLSGGNHDYKNYLLEVMAHPLITDAEFKRMLAKFFICIGKGGNGKGTFLKILEIILNRKNCSALSIKQMADEKYFNTMFGKLVNLGDDIEDEFISKDQAKLIKNIATCDRVAGRRLFENAQDLQLTVSLIFTSNHLLKAREKGTAWKRRIAWLPMDNEPVRKRADFIKELTTPEGLQYWVKLMVEAYKRLYKNCAFTKCSIVEDFNENYHIFNDNINAFLEEAATNFEGVGKTQALQAYNEWCDINQEKPQSKEKLYAAIMERYDLEFGKINIKGKDKTTSTTAFKKKAKK
jgi:putative DNA primase/helicase